jgi:GDP-4-dehydro-6-deoxy-D-mannose reductase
MIALVTGAAGFSGRHLCQRLKCEARLDIVGLDCLAAPPPEMALSRYLAADVTEPEALRRIVRSVAPDFIFHLAGSAAGDPVSIYRLNTLGTVCLLEAVRAEVPGARVLLVGSAAEYGTPPASAMPLTEEQPCQPAGPYGVSKYAATRIALDYFNRFDLKIVIARPFNIVGPGIPPSLLVGAVLHRAVQALSGPEPAVVRIGNLDTERDFVAVEDVVEAYWRMLQASRWGEVFNLCSGSPRSIRSVVEEVLRHAHRPVRLEVDAALVRPSDVRSIYGSWEKARRAFGFVPATPLETALRSAWQYAAGALSGPQPPTR